MNKEASKYVEGWFARGNDDLALVELILEKGTGSVNLACFHAQQAAEKYLKGFLAYHELHVRKVHDLKVLLEACKEVDSSFARLDDSAIFLTQFYTASRYPDDYIEFQRKEGEKTFTGALQIKKFVLAKITSSVTSKGFTLISPMIVITAIVFAVVGGYFLYHYTQPPPPVDDFANLGNQTETIVPPDTSTWQTYRNEKYGFEVKYPPDLEAGEGELSIYKEFSTQGHGVGFSTDFRAGNANTEFEIYILYGYEMGNFNVSSQGSNFMYRKRLRMPGTISVSGIPAIEVDVSMSSLHITESYIKNVYFLKDDVIYVFATWTGFEDWTPEKSQKRIDRFYQILSTLKFLK